MTHLELPFKVKPLLMQYVNPHLIWPSISPRSCEPIPEIPIRKKVRHAPSHRQSKSQRAANVFSQTLWETRAGGRTGWTVWRVWSDSRHDLLNNKTGLSANN